MARTAMRLDPMIWLLFCVFISITTFGMMNVVTAVIVENTLEAALRQREDLVAKADKAKAKAMENIYHVFRVADKDGDGSLTKAEFQFALKRKDVIKWLHDVEIDINGAEGLFDILDYDGSGTLDSAEFVEGLMRARGGSKAKDVLQVQCEVWRAQTWLEDVIDQWVEAWEDRFKICERDLQELKGILHSSEKRRRQELGLPPLLPPPGGASSSSPKSEATVLPKSVTMSTASPRLAQVGKLGETGEDRLRKGAAAGPELFDKPAPLPPRSVPNHGVDSMTFEVARPGRARGGEGQQRDGGEGGSPRTAISRRAQSDPAPTTTSAQNDDDEAEEEVDMVEPPLRSAERSSTGANNHVEPVTSTSSAAVPVSSGTAGAVVVAAGASAAAA